MDVSRRSWRYYIEVCASSSFELASAADRAVQQLILVMVVGMEPYFGLWRWNVLPSR